MARKKSFSLPQGEYLIVLDESHRCGGTNTATARLCAAFSMFHKVLMLSGTPFSTPLRTRAPFHCFNIVEWKHWWNYILEHFGCYVDRHRHHSIHWTGKQVDVQKMAELIRPFMVTTCLEDIPDFGDTIIQIEEMDVKDPGAVDHLCRDINGDGDLMTRRGEIEQHRVAPMIEMTKDILASGKSVCSFFNFIQPIEKYSRAFNITPIQGSTPVAERERIINRFQSLKEPSVIALNSVSGGAGIDLHDQVGVPRVSLISPTWDAIILQQVTGRVWRQGSLSTSVQKLCYIADTLECSVLDSVRKKIQNIETITDADLTGASSTYNPLTTCGSSTTQKHVMVQN